MTKGKKKRYYLTQCLCVLASVGRPWVDQWISLQASAHSEVAEVVQGVEDELPLRGISVVVVLILRRSGRRGTRGDQRGQPIYSSEGQLG